ncbi:MAG: NADPH-ferredoxin reductase FprA [Chloroflexota bacterium]|nr:MAG: NADPH-ferredoxin reductase FprA [Chloroflexota bacterium]
MSLENFHIAVIGAGPAGLYAAQELANAGARVALFNRDIKPGGLAEYGIYPNKLKLKGGLRAQFEKILALPQIEYFGNVTIGAHGALTLSELLEAGFDAVLVTVGAQGTKWLDLPGEQLRGVYHAKDLVYYYNRLPPFSGGNFEIGKNIVIIGVGNVMMDMAHWLVRELRVDTVTAVARRGPAEVKFDKKEFETVGANVDLVALDAEIARCAPFMRAVAQEPDAARQQILAGLPRALPPVSATRLRFYFLASPLELCGDARGHVAALQIENTKLVSANSAIKAKGLGTFHEIPCDTVIFAIGDSIDPQLGLPIASGEFVKNPAPRFPIHRVSYEAFDPQTEQPLEKIFIAGWARQASDGLVGIARKDGVNAAHAIRAYLETRAATRGVNLAALKETIQQRGAVIVANSALRRLVDAERAVARARQLPEYKFATNQEMLAAMDLVAK